ncbi:serine threonine kinase [Brachionus plicatilis]|uniref:Serine threonine kinase n=1 Tax=Brachionus plicatilis TaxID=10195 RepID=A0A3M7RN84_BRAPC|nr:serine threonine kinase [Brachionus plicatilis]
MTLNDHLGTVFSLAVLNNGDLASGSSDSTIKIWNIIFGNVKFNLTGHISRVMSLAVLKNGDLASGSDDRSIKIWNTDNGSLIKTLTGHSGKVFSLTVLNNGDLVSGSQDMTIKIWNTNNGDLIDTLNGHSAQVWSLTVLNNGDLASGSVDRTIKIWNTNNGSLKKTLTDQTRIINSLAVLYNGDLAGGYDDGSIIIFNMSLIYGETKGKNEEKSVSSNFKESKIIKEGNDFYLNGSSNNLNLSYTLSLSHVCKSDNLLMILSRFKTRYHTCITSWDPDFQLKFKKNVELQYKQVQIPSLDKEKTLFLLEILQETMRKFFFSLYKKNFNNWIDAQKSNIELDENF